MLLFLYLPGLPEYIILGGQTFDNTLSFSLYLPSVFSVYLTTLMTIWLQICSDLATQLFNEFLGIFQSKNGFEKLTKSIANHQ